MKNVIKIWAAPLLCGLFAFLLFRFVFFIGYVPTASMEPTIKADSFIFGSRCTSILQRGDIVMFRHDGRYLVKRIVGLPGDVICIDDTRLTLAVNEGLSGATRILAVPDDSYFVLGDNEEHSIDSRFWTEPFIERAQVAAKAFIPLNRKLPNN